MQPYFLPYIGYFQLIASVDVFVVYDNIQYTKKGWINRNRLLRSGQPATFSLPLRSDSDYLDIAARSIAADFDPDWLLRQFHGAYRRAPRFAETIGLVERVVSCPQRNLFAFLDASIRLTCDHIGIGTHVERSSAVAIEAGLRREERVIALCRSVGATTYVNPPGGVDLYHPGDFAAQGLELRFLQPRPFIYRQFDDPFVPWLSIVDVLMFNSLADVREQVASGYDLI
jgi:WbqC-like protein family